MFFHRIYPKVKNVQLRKLIVLLLKQQRMRVIESGFNPAAFSNLARMVHGETISLIAKNEAGEEIGRLTYMPNGGPIDVFVRESGRR